MSENNKLLFKDSLIIGNKAEKIVSDLLNPHVDNIYKNEDFRWDILAKKKDKIIKIEVKYDSMFLKTGNFAVEFECKGKLSGIKTTLSDYYVFVDSKNNVHCILTEKLKELCKNCPIKQADCADGINLNYLVKKEIFLPYKIDLLKVLD